MEEEDYRTKTSLVVSYIFDSLMIISTIFLIWATAIVFRPEEILNASIRFGVSLGFISFIFIMVSILATSLQNLIDVIYALNDGEYI